MRRLATARGTTRIRTVDHPEADPLLFPSITLHLYPELP